MTNIPPPRHPERHTVRVADLHALRQLLLLARARGQRVLSGWHTPEGDVEVTLTL